MKIVFDQSAWDDLVHLQKNDEKVFDRTVALIEECRRHPFTGTGKPEPLRQNLSGWWSRRITGEHRLVYRIIGKGDEQRLEIAQCRFHY